ncbi:MAG: hypothetical protein KatS3mg031_0640 [Chitinophagales bacterium]|nr:MAG: hypothetical protein KatS3mg031_0640 [Chitinophagales bacterium]
METCFGIIAVHIAHQLDLKGIKSFFKVKPAADYSSELFYTLGNSKYQYFTNYGVVAFCGYTQQEMEQAIAMIQPFLKAPSSRQLRDELTLCVRPGSELQFEFDKIVVGSMDMKMIHVAMLNLAQSVAMDHFFAVTENLLAEIKGFAAELETSGRLSISRKNMLRFIGKALNTQNELAENIYIFDVPDVVWDDYLLDRLHQGLVKHFDLRMRFSELEYTIRIIEDNLKVFRELYHHRESSLLEMIIILLILVEIIDLFISKLF